jgi:SPX domain protein involved in polyphosphate accumulation
LTAEQKELVLNSISPYISPDAYGNTTIRNIYYDTDSFTLIRKSLEKPIYKEKLRIRSYKQLSPGESAFVELKKKYNGIVYKRRVAMPENEAEKWIAQSEIPPLNTQIKREIEYFRSFYKTLRPTIYISYDREAFFSNEDDSFRVTFDQNILYRLNDLSLCSSSYGNKIIDDGKCLMEIKCGGGMPLWMTTVLTQNKIYKTSFSKYGMAYKELLYNNELKEKHYYV